MNKELLMGKSAQPITKIEESQDAGGTTSQNVTLLMGKSAQSIPKIEESQDVRGTPSQNVTLLICKSAQSIPKIEENHDVRGTIPQNITVILPAFNEEVSIGSIVLLTRHYADHVIVVDDGSSDRTAAIARNAGAHVIVHEANKGKGGALKTGFTAAAALGADVIVTMNSDGQHNPSEIPLLVAPIIDGYAEMVNGSRYLGHADKNTPIYRRIGQTILDTATNMNSGFKITDSQSGFRAFAASTKNVFRFSGKKTAIENEMLADAGRSGVRITEVEIGTFSNPELSPENPVKYIRGALKAVVEGLEANRFLYFYSAPGFALATYGFYMGFKFLEAFFFGSVSLNFGNIFLMVFLSLAGAYMTIRGIVEHLMAGAARQIESV